MVDAVIADCSPTNCGYSTSLIFDRASGAALLVVDCVLLPLFVCVHAPWARHEEGRSAALGKIYSL